MEIGEGGGNGGGGGGGGVVAMSGPRQPYCRWRRVRMPEILLRQSGCLGAVAAQLSEFLSLRMKVSSR